MNEQAAQEEKEEDSDAEYAKKELPRDGIFCQRVIPHKMMKGIKQVHREQGPEIMAPGYVHIARI